MARCEKRTTGHPPVVVPGGCGPERPMPAPPHVPHDVFPIPEAEGIKGTLALLKGADALLSSIDVRLKALADEVEGLPAVIESIEGKVALIEAIDKAVTDLSGLVAELGSATSSALERLAQAVGDVQAQADGLQVQLDSIGEIDAEKVDTVWEESGG